MDIAFRLCLTDCKVYHNRLVQCIGGKLKAFVRKSPLVFMNIQVWEATITNNLQEHRSDCRLVFVIHPDLEIISLSDG
jgi:hypothetical protein